MPGEFGQLPGSGQMAAMYECTEDVIIIEVKGQLPEGVVSPHLILLPNPMNLPVMITICQLTFLPIGIQRAQQDFSFGS